MSADWRDGVACRQHRGYEVVHLVNVGILFSVCVCITLTLHLSVYVGLFLPSSVPETLCKLSISHLYRILQNDVPPPLRQSYKRFTSSRNHLSRSLADRWGTIVDFTTNFLHSSRFSAFGSMIFHSRQSSLWCCLPIVSKFSKAFLPMKLLSTCTRKTRVYAV